MKWNATGRALSFPPDLGQPTAAPSRAALPAATSGGMPAPLPGRRGWLCECGRLLVAGGLLALSAILIRRTWRRCGGSPATCTSCPLAAWCAQGPPAAERQRPAQGLS